jgi:hypothetical protein
MNASPRSKGKLKPERRREKWRNVNGHVIVIGRTIGSDDLTLGRIHTRQGNMTIMRDLTLEVMIVMIVICVAIAPVIVIVTEKEIEKGRGREKGIGRGIGNARGNVNVRERTSVLRVLCPKLVRPLLPQHRQLLSRLLLLRPI